MSEQSQVIDATANTEHVAAPDYLKRKYRWGESLIQMFLFACSALSIFTTGFIIYVLLVEATQFFTEQLLENTNRTFTFDVAADQTTIRISTSGFQLQVGDEIKVGEEEMFILSVTADTIVVERGVSGTTAVAHPSGATIFRVSRATFGEFFTSTTWIPQLGRFGVWPLLNATAMTSTIAMLVAMPLGLATAIFLREYASDRLRNILKPMLEILAGIPTVVYGYFALTFITPVILQSIFGSSVVDIYNTAAAGITIGILTLPVVATLAEDALAAVPDSLREASYALGATRFETALQVVVPGALSGIIAAFILAASRAVGETMIVALAAGAGPNFTFNPFKGAETITGHIVRISGGDLPYGTIDYRSLFALGLLLFFITLVMNIISRFIVARFQEKYD